MLALSTSKQQKFTIKGTFPCKVVKVYDGDTVHVNMDIFGDIYRFVCRLRGINSPEMDTAAGEDAKINLLYFLLRETLKTKKISQEYDAKQFLRSLSSKEQKEALSLSLETQRVTIHGFEKYGRLLIDLSTKDGDEWLSLNDTQVNLGFAKPYMV